MEIRRKRERVQNYAERLSSYPNKGVCGLPEKYDSSRIFERKIEKFVDLLSESKHIVFLTGAGISTDAGVPDFRGPNGIWTKEKERENNLVRYRKRRRTGNGSYMNAAVKESDRDKDSKYETALAAQLAFEKAKPTLGHIIITEMEKSGFVKYLISQNVDALHLRSGFPREKLAEVHGNLFMEKCSNATSCGKAFLRDTDVGGIGMKPTGNACEKCGEPLKDTVLDWEDALPEPEITNSIEHCKKSDLVVCLGTSLRIQPVGDWPLLAKKFVIVNLQKTPIDHEATLVIRERIDKVLLAVKEKLLK